MSFEIYKLLEEKLLQFPQYETFIFEEQLREKDYRGNPILD
jgi:hypothetical protein